MKIGDVKIVKEVMACEVSPVAMFFNWEPCNDEDRWSFVSKYKKAKCLGGKKVKIFVVLLMSE